MARRRSLIFGVGINDVNNGCSSTVEYRTWRNMLKRCYHKGSLEAFPSYVGCSVCDEWILFSNFKRWMEKQDWKGKCLDKDILIPGNKIYSPRACAFVRPEINALILDSKSSRGKYPQGVYFDKRNGKFRAKCRRPDGKHVHLGRFDKVYDAQKAYVDYKASILRSAAKSNPDIFDGLMAHAKKIESQLVLNQQDKGVEEVRITYEQAKLDHAYLWGIDPACDMTGGYVDQYDLEKMLNSPSKVTARHCFISQIEYRFLRCLLGEH